MVVIRIPRATPRRLAAVVALAALVGGGGLAVAATAPAPSTTAARITVPAVAVHQAAGIASVPPLPVIPDLAPLYSPSDGPVQGPDPTAPAAPTTSGTPAADAIPAPALAAYRQAATLLGQADPACRIDWALLAGIGRIESDHGRWGGNLLTPQGRSLPGIYGIALDGAAGTALIRDTDDGRLDRDRSFDRAVGPMQFIPGTWRSVAADGNGDGVSDPQNITDAATAAGVYLCSGPGDLTRPAELTSAILRYNNSLDYVHRVVAYADAYRGGVTVLPATAVPPSYYSLLPVLPGAQPEPSPEPGAPATAAASPTSTHPAKAATPRATPRPATTTAGPQPVTTVAPAPPPSSHRPAAPLDPVRTLVRSLVPTLPAAPSPTSTTPTTPSPTQTCLLDLLGVEVCSPL